MGVPKFAAWIMKKYPQMVLDKCPSGVHGLYVDLNGVIHPCCHSETDPSVALQPEAQKLRNICLAVETLVATTMPSRLVYIAIDGVAPRAKMNQQRARRYMSKSVPIEPVHDQASSDKALAAVGEVVASLEREFSVEERVVVEDELNELSKALGANSLYGSGSAAGGTGLTQARGTSAVTAAAPTASTVIETVKSEESGDSQQRFDNNCLSPGTAFMSSVSTTLRSYIEDRLREPQSRWAHLTVIFSDSNSPGEGEHKLIDFLRTQSSHPGFNGNGSHMIAGSDADLVFLALSLHIPQVYILRDEQRQPPQSYHKGRRPQRPKFSGDGVQHRNSSGSDEGDAGEETVGDADRNDGAAATFVGSRTTVDTTSGLDDGSTTTTVSPTSMQATAADAMSVALDHSYKYYSIDVVGGSVVSEVHELCRVKGARVELDYSTSQARGDHIAANGYDFDRIGGRPDGPLRANATPVSAAIASSATGDANDEPVAGEVAGQRDRTSKPKRPRKRDGGEEEKSRVRRFHPCTAPCNSRVIDDFIVLGLLMGNDFMPRVPSAFCGESAMDNLLEVYVSAVLPHGFLTHGDHDVSLLQLRRFLEAYARVEAVHFREFALQTGRMTTAEATLPLRSEPDERCWRRPYYNSTTIGMDNVTDACRSYVEGIRFVWRYYTKVSKEVSWSWYYTYHHGPFASDLADFLAAQGDDVQRTLAPPELETTPPDTFSQLLCILPPASRHCLPPVFHSLMQSPPPELRDTFPQSWSVDFAAAFGKDHLAATIMPFANMEALRKRVQEERPNLTAEELLRLRNSPHHIVMRCAAAATGSGGPNQLSSPESWSSDSDDPLVEPSTTTMEIIKPIGTAGFQVQGGGLCALPKGAVPWRMQPGVWYGQLTETTPVLCRPRTYSFTVPIPNMSLRPDGSLVPSERRPFRGRGGGGWQRNKKGGAKDARGDTEKTATAVHRFPYFAEFMVCVGVAVVATTFTCVALPSSISMLLQVAAVLISGLALSFILGIGTSSVQKGFPMHRNKIFTAFVDWICAECMFLNFSRNTRCFYCKAPFDPHRSWAIYKGKNRPEPPLMDPDHGPHYVQYSLR